MSGQLKRVSVELSALNGHLYHNLSPKTQVTWWRGETVRDCSRGLGQSGVSGNNPAVLRKSQLLWLPANHLHKVNRNPNMVQGVPIHTLNEELLKVDCYQERKSQFS